MDVNCFEPYEKFSSSASMNEHDTLLTVVAEVHPSRKKEDLALMNSTVPGESKCLQFQYLNYSNGCCIA